MYSVICGADALACQHRSRISFDDRGSCYDRAVGGRILLVLLKVLMRPPTPDSLLRGLAHLTALGASLDG